MQSLRNRRIERGITMEKAIRDLNISRPTFMKYEQEPRKMPLGKFLDLCDYLGIADEDIFLLEGVKETKRKEAKHGAVANQ